MSLSDRARQHGAQAEREFVLAEADALEQTNEALKMVLAAIVVQQGGSFLVGQDALVFAEEHGLSVSLNEIAPGGVEITVASLANPRRPRPQEAPEYSEPPAPPVTRLEPPQPATPPEDDGEDDPGMDAETPEARHERYLARRGMEPSRGVAPTRAQSRPTLRPWDSPEDLAYQEMPGRAPQRVIHPDDPNYNRIDHRARELSQPPADGSIQAGGPREH